MIANKYSTGLSRPLALYPRRKKTNNLHHFFLITLERENLYGSLFKQKMIHVAIGNIIEQCGRQEWDPLLGTKLV